MKLLGKEPIIKFFKLTSTLELIGWFFLILFFSVLIFNIEQSFLVIILLCLTLLFSVLSGIVPMFSNVVPQTSLLIRRLFPAIGIVIYFMVQFVREPFIIPF
jgi:hypothetical protein